MNATGQAVTVEAKNARGGLEMVQVLLSGPMLAIRLNADGRALIAELTDATTRDGPTGAVSETLNSLFLFPER